jgi:hypothetical protein
MEDMPDGRCQHIPSRIVAAAILLSVAAAMSQYAFSYSERWSWIMCVSGPNEPEVPSCDVYKHPRRCNGVNFENCTGPCLMPGCDSLVCAGTSSFDGVVRPAC